MIIPTDQYVWYTIPIPQEVLRGEIMDYVLRQLEKYHPCMDTRYKADVLIAGWGKKRQAQVVVISDIDLLQCMADCGRHLYLQVREPVRRQVFPRGPVTQCRRRTGFVLPVLGVILLLVLLCVGWQRPAAGNTAEGVELMNEVYMIEEPDETGGSEEYELIPVEDEPVQDMSTGDLSWIEDRLVIVGTVFGDDGRRTVYYRDYEGKLQTLQTGKAGEP